MSATTQAKGVGVNNDAALEQEADEMGARAAQQDENGNVAEPGSRAGFASIRAPASSSRGVPGAIQLQEDEEHGESAGIDPPVGGINQTGFIDHDDGSNIRSRPAELAGSQTLTTTPLPPATRVFVSGQHPQTAEWLYVSAFLPEAIVRGYVGSSGNRVGKY